MGTREAWDEITLQLLVRSGGLCEARSPACLAAPDGRVESRPDGRLVAVSRHHRLPRGMGGTTDEDVDGLARLLLVCGDGVIGCHGWIESQRDEALRRGLLVARGYDLVLTPVELASGRLVLLDAGGGFYLDAGWAFPGRD